MRASVLTSPSLNHKLGALPKVARPHVEKYNIILLFIRRVLLELHKLYIHHLSSAHRYTRACSSPFGYRSIRM